jgi:sugar/nucleoside kinase (ribokinase family)
VALDNVQTPAGSRTRTLGGACTYFSTAARLYAPVSMVGVVGTDFPPEHVAFLRGRGIDVQGLQIVPGQTFFWAGRYTDDLNQCETLDTQLNVFADFHPLVPPALRQAEYVFLANIHPSLQIEVLQQMQRPKLVALDSMNYWIASQRETLTRALALVDVVFLNEAETRQFAGVSNVIEGANRILDLGPKAIVIKKGEYGAMLVTRGGSLGENLFITPAFPLHDVVDPTGAGDTFAAGFMGYLARCGEMSLEAFRRAVVHGTVVASFTVQDFSIDRLRTLTMPQIEARYHEFRKLTHFEAMNAAACQDFQRAIC